jgi:hypothetical protein
MRVLVTPRVIAPASSICERICKFPSFAPVRALGQHRDAAQGPARCQLTADVIALAGQYGGYRKIAALLRQDGLVGQRRKGSNAYLATGN